MMKTQKNKEILLNLKSLYLIKNSSIQEGKNILKELIKNDSKLKFLAEDILEKKSYLQ